MEQWDLRELVVLRAGGRALAGVPPLPRRRADADARRRARDRDERAHRRADPRAAAAGPLARGRTSRPRAGRADLGGLDRAVGGVPASRAASRAAGRAASRAWSCATAGSRARPSPGQTVTADFYVAALPVEVMRTLLSPELRRAEPRLNGLDRLVTRWMNGILFYLRDDLPLVHGHAIYLDSEWALTSISQRQFWRDVPLPVGGVLSIDISEWQRAGARHRQGRRAVHAGGDPRRGLGAAARSPRRHAGRGRGRVVVPRRGDRVPEPVGRDQRRAAAGQHEGLVGRSAGGVDRGSRT